MASERYRRGSMKSPAFMLSVGMPVDGGPATEPGERRE
jgi:hypothetical protein